jgi:hypothetical protein
MGLPLRFALNGADEVKAANYPDIRFFTVTTHVAYRATDLLEGKWNVVSPQTMDMRSMLEPDSREMHKCQMTGHMRKARCVC